ncbi:MAG: phage tail tape measure protein [Pseudomonadota bacterium]
MDRTLSLMVKFAALDRLTAPIRNIGRASREAGRDMAATKREVLQLERSTAKIGGFRDLQRALSENYQALDQARRKVRDLRAEIQQTDGPTGQLTRQLTAAQNKVERLSTTTGNQTEKLKRLGAELQDAGVDVRRLASEEDRLGDAIGRANRRLDDQRAKEDLAARRSARVAKADAMGSRMQSTGLSMMAGGAVIGAPLIAAANGARDTQSAMTDIAITAGLGADETRRMSNNIQKLAGDVGQLPDQLRTGVGTLIASGLDPRVAMAMLPKIGRAATAEKAGVDDLARSSFAFYNNLKVPIGEVGRALDVMTLAGKRGGVELKDMAGAFPSLTAAAQGLGQTGVGAVADLAAALQIAKNGAANADEASNNVLNLLNKINSTETIGNFKKMGIDLPNALKKAYADGKTPLEAIIELTKQATKGDTAKLPFLFNDAQVQGALRPLIAGFDQYKALRAEALAKGGGTIDADFGVRMARDPAAQQAAADANLSRASNTIGTAVNPALTAMRIKLGNAALAFSDWAERSPAAARAVTLSVAGLSILLTGLGALAMALGVIVGPLTRGWNLLGRLGTRLRLIGPWILRIGSMFSRFGGILRFLIGPIGTIGRTLLMALGPIAGALGAVTAPIWLIGAAVVAVGLAIVAAGVWIYNNWRGIAAFFSSIFASFAAATAPLRASLGRLVGALGALGGAFIGWVGRVVAPVVAGFANMGGAIMRFIQPAIDWIGRLVGPIAIASWQAWGSAVGGFIGGVYNKLKRFVDFLTSGVSALTDFFNGANQSTPKPATAGKAAPATAGKPRPRPIAGARADGGPVTRGKSYLVGERGPEILEMPVSGTIVPNHELNRRRLAKIATPIAAAGALMAAPIAASPPIRQPAPLTVRATPPQSPPALASHTGDGTAGSITMHNSIDITVQAAAGEDADTLARRIAEAVKAALDQQARMSLAARGSSYLDQDAD